MIRILVIIFASATVMGWLTDQMTKALVDYEESALVDVNAFCEDAGEVYSATQPRIDPDIRNFMTDPEKHPGYIAKGGFGAVFRVTYNGQLAAAKIVKFQKKSEKFVGSEIYYWLRMGSFFPADVPQFYGCMRDTNNAYIIMELMDGDMGSVAGQLQSKTALASSGLKALVPMTEILIHLHSTGIVHHDIKPENFFYKYENGAYAIKLGDFGLAYKDANTGDLVGSTQFMPPEKFNKQPLTPSVDVYSLGITFWAMFSKYPGVRLACYQVGAMSSDCMNQLHQKQADSLRRFFGSPAPSPDLTFSAVQTLSDLVYLMTHEDVSRRPDLGQVHQCISHLYVQQRITENVKARQPVVTTQSKVSARAQPRALFRPKVTNHNDRVVV